MNTLYKIQLFQTSIIGFLTLRQEKYKINPISCEDGNGLKTYPFHRDLVYWRNKAYLVRTENDNPEYDIVLRRKKIRWRDYKRRSYFILSDPQGYFDCLCACGHSIRWSFVEIQRATVSKKDVIGLECLFTPMPSPRV